MNSGERRRRCSGWEPLREEIRLHAHQKTGLPKKVVRGQFEHCKHCILPSRPPHNRRFGRPPSKPTFATNLSDAILTTAQVWKANKRYDSQQSFSALKWPYTLDRSLTMLVALTRKLCACSRSLISSTGCSRSNTLMYPDCSCALIAGKIFFPYPTHS